jgi:hypothetical protein
MSDSDENDVLKRLRDVRKRLQESLSDDGGKVVEAQEPTPEPATAPSMQKGPIPAAAPGDTGASKGPKLYKTKGDDVKKFSEKRFKETTGGVSRRRMAGIQRRIKEKVESRKRMSAGRRAILLIAMMAFSMPYFFMSTLALTTCRFDFNGFGLTYMGQPGSVVITLPVTNPSFLPAKLGVIQMDVYNEATGQKVGAIYTNYERTLLPYQTVTIELALGLDPNTAGPWLESLFNSLTLRMSVRNFRYNGMKLIDKVELPSLDLSSMITDLTADLNLDSLIRDLVGDMSVGANTKNTKDLWKMATRQPNGNPYNGNPQPGEYLTGDVDCADISFVLMDLGLEETDEHFAIRGDLAFGLPELEGFNLGPIRITDLKVSLYGPSVNGSNDTSTYTNEIARISTYSENLTAFNHCGVTRDTRYPIEVNLGGIGFASVKFQLFKDDLNGALEHPSASLNFTDSNALAAFESAHRTDLSTWYFFQNLLAHQMIDVVIGIDALSVQIFGIDIKNVTLPPNVARLPLQTPEPLFNLDELLAGLTDSFATQPLTLFSGIGTIAQIAGTAGLSIPRPAQPSFNLSAFDDIQVDLNADDLLSSLVETEDFINLSLGIGLDNTFLDLHLGLKNVSLAIANEVNGVTRGFLLAKLMDGSDGDDFVFLNGLGSRLDISLNLSIMKGEEEAPHIAKLLRDVIEKFTIEGRAIAGIEYLILFKEKYTFQGITIPIELQPLIDGLGLEDMLVDEVKGLLEGDIADMVNDLLATEESAIDTTTTVAPDGYKLKYDNPLMAPIELISKLIWGSPIFSPLTGYSIPGSYLETTDGRIARTPQEAEDIVLEITETTTYCQIFVIYPGLEIEPGMIPVHIGVGPISLEIQTNRSNNYGDWETLLAINLEQYIGLGPEGSKINLVATITIYSGGALCSFLDSIFLLRDGPSFDLRLNGYLNINLSGVVVNNLHLSLAIPAISLNLPLQPLLDALLGTGQSADTSKDVIGPMKATAESTEFLWDGDYKTFPLMAADDSPSLNLGDYFQIGDNFGINSITETGWPDKSGQVTIDLSLPLFNGFMALQLIAPRINITADNGVTLIELFIVNDPAIIYHKQWTTINARVVLHKSPELQNFISAVLWDGSISGRLYASLGIKIFGCTLGPLVINTTLVSLLEAFGLDLSSLLMRIIPLNEYSFRDSPKASQFDIDLLGDFGIAYVTTKRSPGQTPLVDVGPQDFDNPMFSVLVGLALRPNFNMSLSLDLTLCDKNIYSRIVNNPLGTKEDAVKYSKVASVVVNPQIIYCNNTYDPNADFTKQQALSPNVNGSNYMYYIDPMKPYYNWSMNNTGSAGLSMKQMYNETTGAKLLAEYGTGNPKDNMMGTFNWADLELQLFNISYGSWENRYPKQYWRSLGGPYFPPQVFGPDYGGYPDHRVVYHPNYSPLANILSQVEGVIGGDLDALLSNIQIAGYISINIFSMDIVLDASSPLVEGLVGALMTESMDYLMEGYRDMVNPWRKNLKPEYAYAHKAARVAQYDDPSIVRFASSPLQSEFSTDLMALDMESFIDNYPYLGLNGRYDHCFGPGISGLSYDGTVHYLGNSRDMGTNICPWADPIIPFDYTNPNDPKFNLDPTYRQGVKDGPGDPASNVENFVKDRFYDRFKLESQAWADSRGQFNPFFESENYSTIKFASAQNNWKFSYEKLADTHEWALRWQNDKQQRTPTFAGVFAVAVIPAFHLGLLSAYGRAYSDDPNPIAGGCGIAPIGYVWVNSSIYPRTVIDKGGDTEFWKTSPVIDDNGNVASDSNWAMLNIRLFDSLATYGFFQNLIGNISNLNINLFIDIEVNASLFGYETYGLALGGLALGDPGGFAKSCVWRVTQASTGTVWGTFNTNGTISPPTTLEQTLTWLHKEWLPQFEESGYEIDVGGIINLNDLLSGLTNFDNWDLGNLMTGLTVHMKIRINTPLFLNAWLTYLEGTLVTNNDQKKFIPENESWPNPLNWREFINLKKSIGETNTGALWTEVDAYYDNSSNPNVYLGRNRDPYNYAGNPLGSWPSDPNLIGQENWKQYAGQTCVQFGESIELPTITLTIGWDDLGYVLDTAGISIGKIAEVALANIFGDPLGAIKDYLLQTLPYYLWMTILQNRFEMFKLTDTKPGQANVPNLNTVPNGVGLHLLLPPGLGYEFSVILPYDLIFMNLMAMIRPLLGEDENWYDSKGNRKDSL